MDAHLVDLVAREQNGHVTVLTLNAPERRNALSLELRAALADALRAALADPACRIVILAGAGGHFSAGGDILGMDGLDAVSGRRRLGSAHEIIRMLIEGEKPVIAAVEGYAVGAGLSLAAACDIVVASREARFACSFNRIGLTPDFGLAYTLPLRVGMGRARQIMLTGDTFEATEAAGWGLVEYLAEPGDALAQARELALRIAGQAAPLSNAMTKSMLAALPCSLDDALRAEADKQGILFTTSDFAEGRAAFLAKRKPVFEGR